MAEAALIGIAAGTALQISGQRKASKAQEAAALRDAEIKRQQAEDILERLNINTESIEREGQRLRGRQEAAFASSGVDVGSNISLIALEETSRSIDRALDVERFEAQAQINVIESGAEADRQRARDIRSTRDLNTAGIFLSGLGQFGSGLARTSGTRGR